MRIFNKFSTYTALAFLIYWPIQCSVTSILFVLYLSNTTRKYHHRNYLILVMFTHINTDILSSFVEKLISIIFLFSNIKTYFCSEISLIKMPLSKFPLDQKIHKQQFRTMDLSMMRICSLITRYLKTMSVNTLSILPKPSSRLLNAVHETIEHQLP